MKYNPLTKKKSSADIRRARDSCSKWKPKGYAPTEAEVAELAAEVDANRPKSRYSQGNPYNSRCHHTRQQQGAVENQQNAYFVEFPEEEGDTTTPTITEDLEKQLAAGLSNKLILKRTRGPTLEDDHEEQQSGSSTKRLMIMGPEQNLTAEEAGLNLPPTGP